MLRTAWRVTGLSARLGAHMAARITGRTPPLPLNLTVSVTRRCDSHCSTCGIWCADQDGRDELDARQYEKLFASIGPGSVYFLNISGGEPTLRDDLPDIVRSGVQYLDPAHVHLPTNGIDPQRILGKVEQILAAMEDSRAVLSVKPSLDGVGRLHDEIRGVIGNYEAVRETITGLLRLRAAHPGRLLVGVGTVISRRNADSTKEVVGLARKLGLDSIIHEIAENREEMGNQDWSITPDVMEYRCAAGPFAEACREAIATGDAGSILKAAMRLRMIELTARWLETGQQPLPCYAGITNAHVGPKGGLWACAVMSRTNMMADLVRVKMDFERAWSSDNAGRVRRRIREQHCACPLANQMYANILLSPVELSRALALVLSSRAHFLAGQGM